MARARKKCVTLSELEEYASGSMSVRRSSAIHAHLGSCEECAARWEEFQANEELLGKIRKLHRQRARKDVAWDRLTDTMTRVEKNIR